MEPYDSDALSTDGVVDELMPDDFDWRDMVRKHPILGRSRGQDILAALAIFAADSVSGQVNELLGKDVL
jgi:hypothetical protein